MSEMSLDERSRLLREMAPRAAEAQQRLDNPEPQGEGYLDQLVAFLRKIGKRIGSLSDAVPTPPRSLDEAARSLPEVIMPNKALDMEADRLRKTNAIR
jgi:hypothetical protein